MATPYYTDDLVTLYQGDCREITEWLAADVLVTDPPYGRNWKQGRLKVSKFAGGDEHSGIQGDSDTATRDAALASWGDRPAIVFGDLMLPPPGGTKLVAVYRKPSNAGCRGAIAAVRRDIEAVYLVGNWPTGLGGRSSVFATRAASAGNPSSIQGRTGHPHAKPGDIMSELVQLSDGIVADPFAGSGSTLVAAKRLGRHCVGVELEERYCEITARRLDQGVLDFGDAS